MITALASCSKLLPQWNQIGGWRRFSGHSEAGLREIISALPGLQSVPTGMADVKREDCLPVMGPVSLTHPPATHLEARPTHSDTRRSCARGWLKARPNTPLHHGCQCLLLPLSPQTMFLIVTDTLTDLLLLSITSPLIHSKTPCSNYYPLSTPLSSQTGWQCRRLRHLLLQSSGAVLLPSSFAESFLRRTVVTSVFFPQHHSVKFLLLQ